MTKTCRTQFPTWGYAAATALVLAGCAGAPLVPFSTDVPPLRIVFSKRLLPAV